MYDFKMKDAFYALIALTIFGLIMFRGCFTVSDKIGPLGADKYWRQIFIQSWSEYLKPEIEAESDFFDHNFVQRIWVEPMRTTIKIRLTGNEYRWDETVIYRTLSASYNNIIVNDSVYFILREDYSIPVYEIKNRLKAKGLTTVKQFIEALGFEEIVFTNSDGSFIQKHLYPENASYIK